MSTLAVKTITTANAITDLTVSTGNNDANKFVLYSNGSGLAYQNSSANLVIFSVSGSTIGAGFSVSPYNLGITTTAQSITPNPTNGNYQYLNANSTWTLNVPPTDCAIDLLVTNGSSAGDVTISGSYTANPLNAGDEYLKTNTYKYLYMIRRINGISTYVIKSLQ